MTMLRWLSALLACFPFFCCPAPEVGEDEFCLQVLRSYQDKEFKNVNSGDLGLETEEEKKAAEAAAEENKDLFEDLQKALEGKVKAVKLSGRLKSHPVCLSSGEGVTFEMEKYFTAAQPELDLRGMAADEAIILLDNFLDSAYMGNLPTARIIHGKGTGVLRAAVHDELRRCKYVKSFRLGVYGEGESGVTIVEFK